MLGAVMIVSTTQRRIQTLQGFALYVLGNEQVEVAVVPELGGRIISLKNLQTGREWLWHPQTGQKLFTNQPGDAFERSPLLGIDECFPTIAPGTWQGRQLPDHGELWSQAWQVDEARWEQGNLTASLALANSPFHFTRAMEVRGADILLNYEVINLSRRPEVFLWSFHPLFQLQPGDRLQLPESTRQQITEADWLEAVDSAVPPGRAAKVFAPAVQVGEAAIRNGHTNEHLTLTWDPEANPVLGLWLSRGGWHGHEHFAIEPANGADDCLARAWAQGGGRELAPGSRCRWWVKIKVG